MKKRNSKRVPFIILLIIHTTLLIYTFYKNKDRKRLFVLLIANIGFAYFFEYIVLNLFQAYQYSPNFLKNKKLDSSFGAILSQTIYVPFTAVFITAFQHGWKVKLLFAVYFATIEKLFIKMGIFKTNWWKTIYTATLIPTFFIISDFWFKHLKLRTPSVIYISLFNMIVVANANILYVFALLRKLRFGLGSFHSWREHFILVPLYTIAYSLITVFSIKKSWFNTVKAFSFFFVTDWFLKKLGLLKIKFSLGYLNMIFHLVIHIIALYYKKLLFSEENKQ